MWMPNAIIPRDHLFVHARLVMWEMVKIVQVRNSSVLWFLTIHRIHRGDRSGAPNAKMRYCKIKWQGFERCIYLSIWNEKSFGWYRQFSIILISASFNYEQTCEVYQSRSPPLSICTNVNAKHNVTYFPPVDYFLKIISNKEFPALEAPSCNTLKCLWFLVTLNLFSDWQAYFVLVRLYYVRSRGVLWYTTRLHFKGVRGWFHMDRGLEIIFRPLYLSQL